MRFRYLGPLEVFEGQHWQSVAATKQRLLLAALLVNAGSVVSRDELVDTLWPEARPVDPANQVHGYVRRLRRLVGDAGGKILVTSTPGYLIAIDPSEIDACCFERQARDGRAAFERGDLGRARETLVEALALWRGPAFADLQADFVRAEADRLEELRLSASLTRIDADLSLGHHDEPVTELSVLVEKHPLREQVWERLLLGLYRAGRQHDALDAYRRVYRLLDQELGIQPGRRLQRLHQQVLNRDPRLDLSEPPAGSASTSVTRPTIPRQLPAHPPGFVGRSAELRRLTTLLDEAAGAGGAVVISTISGAGGVGKTALALYWAHSVTDKFPDGQLYVNLRGFADSEPTTPTTAIRSLLDALGTDASHIPADLDGQSALLRSLTAGRRVLMVLDNAHDADQVEPLLPGVDGPLVVVTSRRRLPGLIVRHGARTLDLDVLTAEEATDLLVARLGADRVRAAPDALNHVIEQCARLPLALSVVAARAALHPGLAMATVAAELADERTRLRALDAGDTTASVRTAFSWSYRQLNSPAGHMFRLLGIHPGPDISVPAAASLAGIPVDTAANQLDELVGVHLITEHTAGRFTFHDLLRAYASERAEAEDSTVDRHSATRRSLDHYLHTAHAAADLIYPQREATALAPPCPDVTTACLTNRSEAITWLNGERPVLLAVIAQAAAAGFDAHAWQLPRALATFFDRTAHWYESVAIHSGAVASARRCGERAAKAQALVDLGYAYARLGAFALAEEHLHEAIALSHSLADQTGEAQAHLRLGLMLTSQDRTEEALHESRRALELYEAVDYRKGQAHALNNMGLCHGMLGNHQQALICCQQVLPIAGELGVDGQAATLDSLGLAHYHLGQHTDAIRCFRRALELLTQLPSHYDRAVVLDHLGDTEHAVGDDDAAREAWRQALDILDDLQLPDIEAVRAKLLNTQGGCGRDDPAPDAVAARRP